MGISKSELKKFFTNWSEQDCDCMLAAFDKNKDGFIAYEEFVDWVMASSQAAKEQLRAAEKNKIGFTPKAGTKAKSKAKAKEMANPKAKANAKAKLAAEP